MKKLILFFLLSYNFSSFADCTPLIDRVAIGEIHSKDLEFEDLSLNKKSVSFPNSQEKLLKHKKLKKYSEEFNLTEIQGREILDLPNSQRDAYLIIKEKGNYYLSFIIYLNKSCPL